MSDDGLDVYQSHAKNLAARIDDIRAVALDMDRDEDAHVLLREANRLHDHRFQVVVVGEFSRGKSTLINALIGQKLLPAKLRPTTAALTHIHHGAEPRVRVTRVGGAIEMIDADQLASVVTGDGATTVDRVDVTVPCPWLADGVELIDTPGVNDLNQSREDVTLRFLPNADVAIFVLDAKACFSETERAFLARDVLQSNLKRVFFVINKTDQLDGPDPVGEIAKLLERVRTLTRGMVDSPRVFAVAAKPALDAQLSGEVASGTGLPELVAALSRFLATERGEIVLQRVGHTTHAAADRLSEGIAVRLTALEGERAAAGTVLDRVAGEADREASELKRLRTGWGATVSAIAQDIQATVRRRANDVARRLAGSFDGATGAVDIESIQRAVKREFVAIAEEGQRRLQHDVEEQARRVAADVTLLESVSRRLVVTSEPTISMPVAAGSPIVTPTSALAAAGAMGLAAAFSVATGGILVIGALAFLAVRASEQQNSQAVARNHFDRLIAQATDQLCAALAAEANAIGETTWMDVGGAAEMRAAETARALREARGDLERTDGSRQAEARRLRALNERLSDVRAGVSRAVLDGLVAVGAGR